MVGAETPATEVDVAEADAVDCESLLVMRWTRATAGIKIAPK